MQKLWRVVIWWFSLSWILYAYNLRQPLRPRNELGITLDYSLATKWPNDVASPKNPRAFMWSSRITFNEDVSSITDAELWGLAIDAYNYISDDMHQYGIWDRQYPVAMGVLAYGKTLIFSSSQKGMQFTTNTPQTVVSRALQECQATWRDLHPHSTQTSHRNNAACAEVMAAQQYYLSPDGQATSLRNQNGRVGTVLYRWDSNTRTQRPLPSNPCGTGQAEWGCNLFTENQNMRPIDITIAPEMNYVLANLAGGVAHKDQIQLCGNIRTLYPI